MGTPESALLRPPLLQLAANVAGGVGAAARQIQLLPLRKRCEEAVHHPLRDLRAHQRPAVLSSGSGLSAAPKYFTRTLRQVGPVTSLSTECLTDVKALRNFQRWVHLLQGGRRPDGAGAPVNQRRPHSLHGK